MVCDIRKYWNYFSNLLRIIRKFQINIIIDITLVRYNMSGPIFIFKWVLEAIRLIHLVSNTVIGRCTWIIGNSNKKCNLSRLKRQCWSNFSLVWESSFESTGSSSSSYGGTNRTRIQFWLSSLPGCIYPYAFWQRRG